jgi:FG-GAP-like repeat
VYDGRKGTLITKGPAGIHLDSEPALGDVDNDGQIELVADKVYRWNRGTKQWDVAYPGGSADFGARFPVFYGFADFDGDKKAEVVTTGNEFVAIYKLTGEKLMRVELPPNEGGGPPTIGDFDGDHQPEVASAGGTAFRVFDLDCKGGGKPGCEADGIRWSKPSQDATSKETGSTIFDFEGDGVAEAVYADECFLRVYNGKTGDVLFSAYRNSCTWWEQPIIADPDNSDRTKLIVNSNTNCAVMCNDPRTTERGNLGFIDKEHPGVRCRTTADCVSNSCVEGFCRCTTDEQCGVQIKAGPPGSPPAWVGGLVCANPIPGTPGTGNVCRMQHPNPDYDPYRSDFLNGIKVYRDRLDRWASSRPLWNQHVYSINNINDDGKVPKTSEWKQNYLDPKLNNLRQNRQGSTSADLADITGALNAADACAPVKVNGMDKIRFTGKICNRGLRGVAASMPAAFYLGTMTGGDGICHALTTGPVPVNGCSNIQCDIDPTQIAAGSTVTMVVNDAGKGQRITDECNYANNTASVVIDKCEIAR